MSTLSHYTKLQTLPPDLKKEAMDFIDFLVQKTKKIPKNNKPVFGCLKGKIKLSDDFDQTLDVFNEYM